MGLLNLSIRPVAQVSHSELRAVAFLRGDDDLNAGTEFDKIQHESIGKRLMHRMGLWIAFHPDTPGKFHRFKNGPDKYRECFAFIDLESMVRLYGFTCHPLRAKPRFELIVLTTHAIKKRNHTDTAELDRVIAWKNNMATKRALEAAYPEHGGR
jgi:hypothetical protein